MLKIVFLILSAMSAVGIGLTAEAFSTWAWLWVLPVGFAGTYLGLLVGLFVVVLIMAALVDMDKVQERDNSFYRAVAYGVVSVAMPLLRIRFHVEGLEKTPKEGRCLVVCNHLFELDPIFLLLAFREKRLAFISKREVDKMFIVGKFLHKMLGQPINRENDREALKTILNCVQIIKENKASIAVFPEGYIHPERRLYPFRSGVFKIAQRANVPVVVCTLRNTQYILKNALRLKPTDVYLHLVGVIPAEELNGVTATHIGDRAYEMMAQDLGPDLVMPTEKRDTP